MSALQKKKLLLLLFAKHERNESEITLGLWLFTPQLQAVPPRCTTVPILGLSPQSSAPWARSILWSLSPGIFEV